MTAFRVRRRDGRSNAQVLLELFAIGKPGQVYSYAELKQVLQEHTDTIYNTSAIQNIATSLLPRLLNEQNRALDCVRGIGYRLAEARDHNRLAVDRKRRADKQMLRGVQLLKGVRWDELSPTERQAHEGTLLLVSALHSQMTALERRQAAVEKALQTIKTKAG